jgi:hypothetical protein
MLFYCQKNFTLGKMLYVTFSYSYILGPAAAHNIVSHARIICQNRIV